MLLRVNRDYRLLLSAGLVSLSGDWVLAVGLGYYVYLLTGSTLASGTVLLASVLPGTLLGSVAGVFADRWDRRSTMIVANLLLAAGLLPLLWVHGAGCVWLCYPVVLGQSCIEQFFSPAQSALLPQLVTAEELLTANALNGQNRDVARLVGGALGGVAVGLGGAGLLAVLDLVSFLSAAALIAEIRFRPGVGVSAADISVAAGGQPGMPRLSGIGRQWRAGLALCLGRRELRVLLSVVAISGIGEGVMSTLFAPFVRDVLHGTGSAYGGIVSAQAVGGIAGGFVAAGLGPNLARHRLLGWGAVGIGLIDLVIFGYPLVDRALWPAFALMVLVGLPAAIAVAGLSTMLQSAAEDSHRGRVFGVVGAVGSASMVLGILGAGSVATVLPIIAVIMVQGIGWTAAGIVVLLALRDRPSLRPG